MHYRAFVTFNKDEAKNSEEARKYAQNRLIEEGFADQERRFNASPADWFVIGGRWSGELTRMQFKKEKLVEFSDEFGKKHGWHTNHKNSDAKRMKQATKLFKKYFPTFKGLIPYWRDTYNHLGYEDDAMIVTPHIYKTFLKEHEGSEEDGEHFWDLDYDAVNPDFIENKWIIILDYHN